jgi:hypothetical protein
MLVFLQALINNKDGKLAIMQNMVAINKICNKFINIYFYLS